MTENSQSEVNPYESPKSENSVAHIKRNCPLCQRPMEHGYLRSSSEVRWIGEEASAMARFVSGGTKLPHKKEAISLGRKYPGYFCSHCLLTIIDSDKNES